MRYDPQSNQIEPILVEACQDITDVAVTPEGVVLVLWPRELDAYVAGHLVKLHDVQPRATRLSCDREFAYILVTGEKGARLLRCHLAGPAKGLADTLVATDDCPQTLCAVPGGCLVASNGNIVKVTDPAQVPGQAEPQVATVLLVALREDITSVAVDPGRSYVYFTTSDSTYVWAEGQILPVFPAGGRLVWVDDTLTICQPGVGQVVQVGSVSGHVRKLLAGG